MADKYENPQTVMCKCGCGIFSFDLWGSNDVDIVYYPWAGHRCRGLLKRIKVAWAIIRGKDAGFYDIVVDREELFTAVTAIKMLGRQLEQEMLKEEMKKESEKALEKDQQERGLGNEKS